jgi:peptidoglycan/LPS O-acetylase OafA/YrhL
LAPSSRSRAEIRPLTSLRFVAALLVFVYHAPLIQPFARDHGLGQAGVGFFFLLSGFILTYTYAGRLDDLRAYAVARFARIYPTYAVSIAIALGVLMLFGSATWSVSDVWTRIVATIAQVLMVQAWIPNENIYLGINSPAWSISVEAFLYAMFPLLLRSLLRSFGSAPTRTIFVAAALTWICAAAIFVVPHHADVWSTYILPPIRLVDFVVGMLLGVAFLRGFQLRGSATVWEAAAIFAVAAAIFAIPSVPPGLQYSLWMLPFWAVLIAVAAQRRGAISCWLSCRVMVRLGEISFAFYLLHVSVLIVADHLVPPSLVTVFALGFTLLGAWALNVVVERPMRTAIRRLGDHLARSLERGQVAGVPVVSGRRAL